MVFNATFNNISIISWRSVLLVEESRVPGENYRPSASHGQTAFYGVRAIDIYGKLYSSHVCTICLLFSNPSFLKQFSQTKSRISHIGLMFKRRYARRVLSFNLHQLHSNRLESRTKCKII